MAKRHPRNECVARHAGPQIEWRYERCRMKTFAIIFAFLVMTIAPAFAALNVFSEKNRF
jgi:hypothetical protein